MVMVRNPLTHADSSMTLAVNPPTHADSSMTLGRNQLTHADPSMTFPRNPLTNADSNMTLARNPLTNADSAFIASTSSSVISQFNSDSHARVSSNNSPVPDERASPQFSASAVVTSQFNPSLMQVNAASGAMDLSDSLNLPVNQPPTGGVTSVISGYHAGLPLS